MGKNGKENSESLYIYYSANAWLTYFFPFPSGKNPHDEHTYYMVM